MRATTDETFVLQLDEQPFETAIRVRCEVDRDGDWPLLMVHGFGDNLQTWKGLRSALRPRGARCIGIDLPGFGHTSLPPEFGRDYVRASARLVLAVARRWSLEKKMTAIGNSLGASVLLCAAALDRGASRGAVLDAAVLLSPATLHSRTPPFVRLLQFPTYKWVDRVEHRAPRRSWRGAVRLLVRLTIRGMLAPGRRPPPEWVESVTEALLRPDVWRDLEQVALELRRVLRGEAPEIARLLDGDALTDIPVAVARGSLDRVIGSRELDRLVARLPRGERCEFREVGHCPQIEVPEQVAELVLATRARNAKPPPDSLA